MLLAAKRSDETENEMTFRAVEISLQEWERAVLMPS